MRIAAICLDTIGDLVLREPLFRALLGAGHDLHLVVRSTFADLVPRLSPRIHTITTQLHPYLFSNADWQAVIELAQTVARALPDALVFPTFSRTPLESVLRGLLPQHPAATYREDSPDLAPWLVKARAAGVDVGEVRWDRLVEVEEHQPEWQKHVAFARAAFGIQLTASESRPKLTPLPGDVAAATDVLRRCSIRVGGFVLAAPLGSTSIKHKALRRSMMEVAVGAFAANGLDVLFSGTTAEEQGTRDIAQGLDKAAFWFGGEGTLGTLVGLADAAYLYFGADTGPMHVAAALGKPVAAVFGGGHWPRFLPAAERGFALSHFVPCFGCNWDCVFDAPLCVTGVDDRRVEANLSALLAGRDGFWIDGGAKGLRSAEPFERALMSRVRDVRREAEQTGAWARRSDALLVDARQEAQSARQWADDAEAKREALDKAAVELREWAEKAEGEAVAARELASTYRAWAERTEALLANARQRADENQAWAERTEALLAQARQQADDASAWARRADEAREREVARQAELVNWAQEAEQKSAAAHARADENQEWAKRTEALLAQARQQVEQVSAWARRADAAGERDQVLQGELLRWAEDAEKKAQAAQARADENQAWAERTEALLARARQQAEEVSAWARRADEARQRELARQTELTRWAQEAEQRAAASQALADENRDWAERAEEMLRQARDEAAEVRNWAHRAEEQRGKGQALQTMLTRWAQGAEDRAAAALRLAEANREWAERTEAMLVQARADGRDNAAWAQRAEAQRERLAVIADELKREASEVSRELQGVRLEMEKSRQRIAELELELEPLRRFARTYRWIYSLHHGTRNH